MKLFEKFRESESVIHGVRIEVSEMPHRRGVIDRGCG